MALNEKDKAHLEKFLKFININTFECLKYNEKTNSYSISLNDVYFYDDLVRIGFSATKSYDTESTVFDNIPDNLKKFFILGFWDGDGYVSISSTEGKNLTGCVSNNKKMLQRFTEYINNTLGKDFCKVVHYDYPRIRLTRNKAKRLLDWMYVDTPIYLDRKHDTYLQFKKADPKYDRPYSNIRLLPSGRYFCLKTYQNQKYTIGTFNTIKETVEAYNKMAKEIGFPEQKYVGEFLTFEEMEECKDE